MVTTLLARRLAGGDLGWRQAGGDLRLGRAGAVTARNAVAFRTSGAYWWLVLSGLAEPVLYLFAIGWGVGALVGDLTLPDGRVVPYLTFLAPALLAAAAMNGAVAESAFNLFAKMRLMKLYQPVLNTPVTPLDIALGELGWALVRGSMYSGCFLAVMAAMGVTTPLLAAAAFPAALLVGFAFGALGMALATVMRTWQDFDYAGVIIFGLFVFSGTFVPVSTFPVGMQVVVQVTPLYHGVELVRAITLGTFSWATLWHAGYLVLAAGLGLAVASRRMLRMFYK